MPYRRKGSKNGVWYIIVGGRRISANTTDEAQATALEAKLRLQEWEQQRMGVKPQ